MTVTVPPAGPPNAPLVVVGRDPGWQEVRDGKPFVGEAGGILNNGLCDAGISRADLGISNVVPSRPRGDIWANHSDAEILSGSRALGGWLALAPRSCIVALGAQAFYACATGEPPPRSEGTLAGLLEKGFGGTITELRGYCWDGPFGPVLAAVHPAFIARTWLPWRATLSWDLKKAARMAVGLPEVKRRSITDPLTAAVVAANELLPAEVLAVDIETDKHCRPTCIAFAASAENGVCFSLPKDEAIVRELLESPGEKVFQNGQFDVTVLRRHGYKVHNFKHDIMLLWHATQPLIAGRSGEGSRVSQKSLRFLASVFTHEPFWKNYQFQSEEERWKLCATDARVTWEIWSKLSQRT